MDFQATVKHEDNNKPVTYQGSQYYVIGHNDLLKTVTIRGLSSNPMFTVPQDVKPGELS